MGVILAVTGVLLILIGTIVGAVVVQQRRLLRARSMFAGRLLVAQDEERARIARELHDAMVQRLLAATHALRVQDGRMTDLQAEEFDAIAEELRSMARALHPTAVAVLGLEQAVRSLVTSLARQGGVTAEVTVRGPIDSVGGEPRFAIYRIAQEALGNAVRHAAARRIDVTLAVVPGAVQLVVADDGRGFASADVVDREGLGLTSMEERARLLGGRLEVRSHPGIGTTVTAQIPLVAGAA